MKRILLQNIGIYMQDNLLGRWARHDDMGFIPSAFIHSVRTMRLTLLLYQVATLVGANAQQDCFSHPTFREPSECLERVTPTILLSYSPMP